MWSVRDLLEPGELQHLRLVAKWQKRPVQGVVIDEVRRQHGSSRRGHEYKINLTKPLANVSDAKLACESAGPLEQLMAKEDIQLVRDCVESMPPMRKAVILLILDGWKHKEIAKSLGISTHTIEHHVRRAKLNIVGHRGW